MAAGKKTGGRIKGTPNKASAERQKKIIQSGLTPLDFMLSILRDETKPTEDRFEAAKAAAPYVHPKLSNVDHQSSDGSMTPKPTTIEFVSPEVDEGTD
ncbi:hypothetical protein [Rhizobium sp. 2MFCol3.1]|uniref:hypothetical protein n=1 Tax=Rhizobium sp. 2MFCol3.1 TaxID=1246459 RepID=UPI00036818B3|nr:hypothetical protein [Rhizobium sp. 2MFCol3.1]